MLSLLINLYKDSKNKLRTKINTLEDERRYTSNNFSIIAGSGDNSNVELSHEKDDEKRLIRGERNDLNLNKIEELKKINDLIILEKNENKQRLLITDSLLNKATFEIEELKTKELEYQNQIQQLKDEKKEYLNSLELMQDNIAQNLNQIKTIETEKNEMLKSIEDYERKILLNRNALAELQTKIEDKNLIKSRLDVALFELNEVLTVARISQQDLNITKKTLRRIKTLYPSLKDYGICNIYNSDLDKTSPAITLSISGYSVGGEEPLPEFEVIFQLNEAGAVAFFKSDAANNNISYDAKLALESAVEFEKFKNMKSKTWRELTAVCDIIENSFTRNGYLDIKDKSLDIVFWRNMILPFIACLKKVPKILRFDDVVLKRELCHSNYEHLWLNLYGISYGEYSNQKLEMRIGSSFSDKNNFFGFSKFEFPLNVDLQKPFESWFEESYDDYGPKFEIRFDLKRGVIDLATLAKLSVKDQLIVRILIKISPLLLKNLSERKVAIQRPWVDWLKLVTTSAEILTGLESTLAAKAKIDSIGEVKVSKISSIEDSKNAIAVKIRKKTSSRKP